MDPLYEQRLRDEVIYLHSLWHQGPPRAAAPRRHHHLQPSQATQFKKEKKRKGTKKPNNSAAGPSSSPGPEWVVPTPPPPPPADVWPSLARKPDPKPPTLSHEEQLLLAAKHAHQHALKTVIEFFRCSNADDDSDSIDSSSDEDDVDDGHKEYSFFSKVFKEDNELREYYEKNFIEGEFSCLVCDAIGGKRTGKKYRGCLPLVQHSITIANTKKMIAHRAFGQAVCKVLGWDIDQLSSIVSLLSDKSKEMQGSGSGDNKVSSMAIVDNVVTTEGDIVEKKNDEAVLDSGSIGAGTLPVGDEGDMDSLTCTVSPKSLEDLGPMHNVEPRATTTTTTPSTHCHHLQPSQTTQFKKGKKQKGEKSKNKPVTNTKESNSSPGSEWAVTSPPPPPPANEWPRLEAKPDPMPSMLSPEDQSKLAAQLAHQHALKTVADFFLRYANADDDSDSIDNTSDENDELMDEDDGRKEYNFFFKVFKEDNKLREYYEKTFVKGEFSCLVCGSLGGKKMGKKFKGCLPLVQHSITIAKTKKRRAHRAFAQAVCKVLGWDINELSSVVSLLSDKSGEMQGSGSGDNKERSMTIVDNVVSVEGDIDEGKNDEPVPESGSIGSGTLCNNDEEDMDSLTCTDADRSLEDHGLVHNVEEPAAKGLTNGIGSGGNNESSLDIVDNVSTAEGDAVVGKIDDAVPESGVIGAGILPNGDEQNMYSLTFNDADKNLEDLGMVHPCNIEEPAAEGFANVNSSLTCPVADQNLENIDMILPHYLDEPIAEVSTSVPLNDNNGGGNEMQDQQMDSGFLNWENKDGDVQN